jgi:hypothetical protein
MKIVPVAVSLGLLGLAAVANADAIYDFSYVGYLDEDLTMAAPHGRPPGGSLRDAHP